MGATFLRKALWNPGNAFLRLRFVRNRQNLKTSTELREEL
jgi:hypothetical protein